MKYDTPAEPGKRKERQGLWTQYIVEGYCMSTATTIRHDPMPRCTTPGEHAALTCPAWKDVAWRYTSALRYEKRFGKRPGRTPPNR